MTSRKILEKWQSNVKAVKAVQVAFDMDEKVQKEIRKAAVEASLSPSDQIRMILGLPVHKKPKRPRLTVSLSSEDYQVLGEKYGIQPTEQLEIKRKLMDELIEYVNES
jgi:rRNA maturation endonuclease Nob1